MNVIIPTHKKWIEKIMLGEKRAELRKTRMKQFPKGGIVYFYETAPTSSVVGCAECYAYTLEEGDYSPSEQKYRSSASSEMAKSSDELNLTIYGMTGAELIDMFGDRGKIWAIWLQNPRRFDVPIPIEQFTGKNFAPQSHIYTDIQPQDLGVRTSNKRVWV